MELLLYPQVALKFALSNGVVIAVEKPTWRRLLLIAMLGG